MARGARQAAQLIEECESFGLATTMVIPSGLALDVQGAAFVKGFRGVDFVISGRARITARQDRDLANNLLGGHALAANTRRPSSSGCRANRIWRAGSAARFRQLEEVLQA
jgi:hypothetical protein